MAQSHLSIPLNAGTAEPCGRLTAVTGVPVPDGEVSAADTLYYTPFVGDRIPLYDGANWAMHQFSELSIDFDSNALFTAGDVRDVYVFNDSGTLRLVVGASWSGANTRSETLTRLNGILTNTATMTGRYSVAATVSVPANRGTYVGSVYFAGTGLLYDTAALRMIWNQYNRVPRVVALINTSAHTYSTASWREWGGGSSRCHPFVGEPCNMFGAYRANITGSGGGFGVGFGLNSTSGPGGTKGEQFNNFDDSGSADLYYLTTGLNVYVAVEFGDGAGTTTFERISMTGIYNG